MPGYRRVKGEFVLFYQGKRHVGSQPDGDSIWFRPRAAKHLRGLADRDADFNAGGCTQLRIEAIDALELHYKGSHQHWNLAIDGRDELLDLIGTQVQYGSGAGLAVRSATPHPIPAYIYTRAIDPYGRPVAFAYMGTGSGADGTDGVWVTAAMVRASLNYKLAKRGHAYPAFYTGLPVDLRAEVAAAAKQAGKRGLWPKDRSMKGTSIPSLTALEKVAIWPKLFRRLVSYFKDRGVNAGLGGFEAWLRAEADRDDQILIGPIDELGNMHDVIRVNGNTVRMRYKPAELIIVPR